MKKIIIVLRVAVAAALVLFLAAAPGFLRGALEHNFYREWMEGEPADWNGVITIWHVVEFKTYQGGVTAFLESCAAQLEKQEKGVYFEVVGLTSEALAERYARGERPDIWSFPSGAFPAETFARLSDEIGGPAYIGNLQPLWGEGGRVALPYLLSGYYLIGNTTLIQNFGLAFPDQSVAESMLAGEYAALAKLLQSAMGQKAAARHGALCAPPLIAARLGLAGALAAEGDFKAGQVPFMIGDARACGDLARKMATGGFTFEAMPLGGFTDQVQYIALDAGVAGAARPARAAHAEAFIALLLSESAQAGLSALGALPAVELAEAPLYADTAQQRFYEAYRMPIAPEAAAYHLNRGRLLEEAARAVESGDFQAFDSLMRKATGLQD